MKYAPAIIAGGLGAAIVLALVAQSVRALDLPVKNPDQWVINCAQVDGGTTWDLNLEENDGGIHALSSGSFVVTNTNSTCANIGSNGNGDADMVLPSTAVLKVGTGASCVNGPSVTIDGNINNHGCISDGDVQDVRVGVWRP